MVNQNEVQQQFLECLLKGNRKQCVDITKDYISNNPDVFQFYEQIIKKSLYDIGQLWESNVISAAAEHLASSICELVMSDLSYNLISDKRASKKIILSCVENEYHQIGLKMVADVFENNGWDAFLLGANTPTKELVRFAKEINPDLLALSLTLYFNLPILENMLREIILELPEQKILIGGQAFTRFKPNFSEFGSNIVILNDIFSINSFLQNIGA